MNSKRIRRFIIAIYIFERDGGDAERRWCPATVAVRFD